LTANIKNFRTQVAARFSNEVTNYGKLSLHWLDEQCRAN